MTWAEAPQRVTTSCVHTVGFDQVVIAIALRFLLMPRILAVVIAAILSIGAASAQDAAPLTLDEAINAARGMSPAIEAASAGVRASNAARTIAGLRPNPSLEAQTENVTGTGPYRRFDSAETTVGLAVPIELGGKRPARVAVADAQGDRARIEVAIAEADTVLRVTQSYIEAVAAERRLGTARDQARIAAEASHAAGVKVAAGRASPIEQQRADVLRINADAAAERAERNLTVARANLARLIGKPVSGGLDLIWFDRVSGYGPPHPVAAEGTLALAAAETDVAKSNAQISLARAQRIPDVTLSASARRFQDTGDTAAVFGLSIPLPLFNNGNAAVAQARAERDQAEAYRRLLQRNTEQAIADAQAEVANAAATARTTGGPVLAAATEAARIARIGYREGKFGQLDLLDAERTLSETRAAATDALASYHDAEARLQRLTGASPSITKD